MPRELGSSDFRYMTMANQAPRLEREEEVMLARRWRDQRDSAARDELVRAQLRGVVAIAARYRHYEAPLSELIAEGNFGLVRALETFDPERGIRLMTYATHWIRAYIVDYIIRSWSVVGGGSGALRSKLFFKLRRERARLYNSLGEGDQADELLAERMGVAREQLDAMLRRIEGRDVRLDAPVRSASNTSFVDTLASEDRSQEDVIAGVETGRWLSEAVEGALRGLNERERYIAERRLMADSQDELSLSEIGRRFGVSRERARQLEARAKLKLRARMRELTGAKREAVLLLSA